MWIRDPGIIDHLLQEREVYLELLVSSMGWMTLGVLLALGAGLWRGRRRS